MGNASAPLEQRLENFWLIYVFRHPTIIRLRHTNPVGLPGYFQKTLLLRQKGACELLLWTVQTPSSTRHIPHRRLLLLHHHPTTANESTHRWVSFRASTKEGPPEFLQP